MWSLFVAQYITRHVVTGNDLCGHCLLLSVLEGMLLLAMTCVVIVCCSVY